MQGYMKKKKEETVGEGVGERKKDTRKQEDRKRRKISELERRVDKQEDKRWIRKERDSSEKDRRYAIVD